jgi:hypothetical protein
MGERRAPAPVVVAMGDETMSFDARLSLLSEYTLDELFDEVKTRFTASVLLTTKDLNGDETQTDTLLKYSGAVIACVGLATWARSRLLVAMESNQDDDDDDDDDC